jgi:hypothetical protein
LDRTSTDVLSSLDFKNKFVAIHHKASKGLHTEMRDPAMSEGMVGKHQRHLGVHLTSAIDMNVAKMIIREGMHFWILWRNIC